MMMIDDDDDNNNNNLNNQIIQKLRNYFIVFCYNTKRAFCFFSCNNKLFLKINNFTINIIT